MATLIPAISACVSRMTSGERRVAERLEQKLDDDYLLWYDVPMGPRNTHPDFCVLHPRRGLLVLEIKERSPLSLNFFVRKKIFKKAELITQDAVGKRTHTR
jgi:hypothetical protein